MSPFHYCALTFSCALMAGACGRLGVELMNTDSLSQTDGGDPDAARRGEDTGVPNQTDAAACAHDSDGDGILDCVDTCGGSNDAQYVPNATCGVGYCRTTNTPSSCVAGKETACKAGTPRSSDDATCDGVDDDCDGMTDENYVPVPSCGVGSCKTRSTPSSCASGVVIACAPAAPLSANDPTKDGIDDDCDGMIDEDACITHSEVFGVGSATGSAGTCTTLTVKLWGAGGASGDAQGGYWGVATTGGTGGAGGFASQTFTVNAASSIRVYVGQGAQGCGNGGANAMANFNGGAGALTLAQDGSAGSDGTVAGGAGARPSLGGNGGNGFFGGGGGGAGSGPGYAPFGGGGGGGAASVVLVDSARLIAGGGGGGGGAGTNVATAGFSGGDGAPGCSGVGGSTSSEAGGGGGGGVCQGASATQRGAGRIPYDAANDLPANVATGGSNSGDCQAGGNGYAIVIYSP
jgi:hypothetical protein